LQQKLCKIPKQVLTREAQANSTTDGANAEASVIRAMPDLAVLEVSAAISTDIFVLHRKFTGKSGRVLDESPTFLDSACHTKRAISD